MNSLQNISNNGAQNTAIGNSSSSFLINGTQNTCLGANSGHSLSSGSQNICIGYNSGIGIISGIQNTCLGYNTTFGNGGNVSGTIFISAGTSSFTPTNSNSFYVSPIASTTSSSFPLVYNLSTGEINYSTSSEAYKENIKDITYNTSNVFDLNVVEYDEKKKDINGNQLHCIGLIAQRVEEVDNNLISYKGDIVEGVNNNNIMMYMLNEMKKMRKELDDAKNEIALLKINFSL